jgi:hypothetical protein
VVAIALETGAAGELIEAALVPAPSGTLTLDKTFLTTCAAAAVGAVATISGQVTDGSGNALAGYFAVAVYAGEAANDGVPYDFGDLAATAGGTKILKEHTADAYAVVQTKSDGSWSLAFTLGSDDTIHASAWVQGKMASASVAVDVP